MVDIVDLRDNQFDFLFLSLLAHFLPFGVGLFWVLDALTSIVPCTFADHYQLSG